VEHLPDPLLPGEALQLAVAEIDKRQALGQVVAGEVGGRLGAQDLPAGRLVEEAGGPVEGRAEECAGPGFGRADVDRQETGVVDKLVSYLSGPPSLRFFDIVE
jgi:hypothetical protein